MKRVKDDKHLENIRQLSCIKCGDNTSTEAAHIRAPVYVLGKRQSGMGEKPHDWYTIPLCGGCHANQHSVGEREFWHPKGIGWAVAVAQALYLAEDHEAREQIIEANRHA